MPRRPASRLPRIVVMALVLTMLAIASGCSLFSDDGTPPPTTIAAPGEVDIPYGDVLGCDGGDQGCGGSQTLDIYRSDEPGPNPVIMWVHGGGFAGGDKNGSLSEYVQPLLDEGWDIVSINYRLTLQDGTNAFPTGLLDTKRAVRWIKANAAAQDWNAQAVAAMGHSAGGNLVEMLAATSGNPDLEPQDLPPELEAQDSSVIGSVALAPVSDLATFIQAPLFAEVTGWYIQCTEDCAGPLERGSVQRYVTPEAAPVLAIHGVDDPFAAPSQGQLVQAAYEAAGIGDRFQMIVVDDGPEEFRAHDVDLERWVDPISEFLDGLLPPGA